MKKYSKTKKKAFTLAEVIITMIIMTIIMSLYLPDVLPINPTQKGWTTLAEKTTMYLEQSLTTIILNDAIYDDFKRLKDKAGYFSIEDANVTSRFSQLIQKHIKDIDYRVDTSNEYFSRKLKNYDKTYASQTIGQMYSNFFYMLDGMLVGLRLYQSCSATEENANPPRSLGKYSVNNVCGSFFIDINSFKKPNTLGLDQYIIPIYKRGIKYINE